MDAKDIRRAHGPAPLGDIFRALQKWNGPFSVGDRLLLEVAAIGNSGEPFYRCWIEKGES